MDIKSRAIIEIGLNENQSIRSIAKQLKVSPSTVLRDIKKYKYLKLNSKVMQLKNQSYEEMIEQHPCDILKKDQNVCNACPRYIKNICTYHFIVYEAKNAQKSYENIKSNSNKKLKLEGEFASIAKEIEIRLNKGQTVNHILISLEKQGIANISKSTVYNWINKKLINYETKEIKRKKIKVESPTISYIKRQELLKDRQFNDFTKYIENNKKVNIVEIDLVCGKQGTSGYILTMFMPSIQFLLGFKLNSKAPYEVIRVFDNIEKKIGTQKFKQIFNVILTDQGNEFLKFHEIEKSVTYQIRKC